MIGTVNYYGPFFGILLGLLLRKTNGKEVPKKAPSRKAFDPLDLVACLDLEPRGTKIS